MNERSFATRVLAAQLAVLVLCIAHASPATAASAGASAVNRSAKGAQSTATTDSTLVPAAEPDLGVPAFELPGVKSRILTVGISPDGRLIAYGTGDALYLRGIPATRMELLKAAFTGQDCIEWCIAFNPQGTRLAACANGMPVSVWDGSGHERWSEAETMKGSKNRTAMTRVFRDMDFQLDWLQFSLDGKRLYAPVPDGGPQLRNNVTGPKKEFLAWDADTGKATQMPSADSSVQFSQVHLTRSKRQLSSPLNVRLAGERKLFVLRNMIMYTAVVDSGRQELHRLEGHAANVISIAVSSQGTYLVSADEAGLVIVWNLETYKRAAVLQWRKARITVVDTNDSGTWAAAGDDEGNVVAWDLRRR